MQRLTYANVMATVAVFIALGGGAYAAATIGSSDVKNNSLTGKDVKNNSLTEKDVQGTRWLLVDEDGKILEQSGGFKTISTPGTNDQPETNPNVYIDAGSSLKGAGLSATIAIQNLVDTSDDGTADPNFSGDVSVGRCASATINCVPTGTNEADTLVLRAQVPGTEGGITGGGTDPMPARAYVQVTP